MNVYHRYFRVTTGVLVEAVADYIATREKANVAYLEIIKEIGAETTYYTLDDRLTGLKFAESPDQRMYRWGSRGWYPKRNVKEGRKLHERFVAVRIKSVDSCLKTVGLDNAPPILRGTRMYRPSLTIVPSEPPVAFVRIPWYDEDPALMAKYSKDREDGKRGRCNMDAILWTPTSDMVEIKSWEADKELGEWNARRAHADQWRIL